jgi:hypothetical protein
MLQQCENRQKPSRLDIVMGTIDDWMRVFLTGAIWVFLMLLIGSPKSKGAKTRPALLGTNVWVWLSWGLFIGLFSVFYWKAFQRPLVFVTTPALVGGFVAGWVSRPKPVLGTD